MEFSRYVLALEFLSENILAAGGEFEGIRILDVEKEQCLQTVKGHVSRVKDLCMTDDLLKEDTRRLLLFSTSSDGDLRGWAFNPDNFEEEAMLVARYQVPGRPTCLTVVGRRSPPTKLEPAAESMVVEPAEPVKEKKKKEKGKADRRTTSTSGDEPKKKKYRTKKKKSTKYRAVSGKKTAKGANNTPERTKDETGAMEANETGESDENDDDGEDEERT